MELSTLALSKIGKPFDSAEGNSIVSCQVVVTYCGFWLT